MPNRAGPYIFKSLGQEKKKKALVDKKRVYNAFISKAT
jgi:hypothetical protein